MEWRQTTGRERDDQRNTSVHYVTKLYQYRPTVIDLNRLCFWTIDHYYKKTTVFILSHTPGKMNIPLLWLIMYFGFKVHQFYSETLL